MGFHLFCDDMWHREEVFSQYRASLQCAFQGGQKASSAVDCSYLVKQFRWVCRMHFQHLGKFAKTKE